MTSALLRIGRRLRRAAGNVRRGGGALYYAQRPLRRARLRVELSRERGPDDVTVALAIRNRKDHRLPNALRCIRGQDWPAELVRVSVVDYGSDAEHVPWLQARCAEAGASYVRVQTRAAWNRSHALNVAIARASTRYVLSSDIDILLAPGYVRRAIELLRAEPLGVVLAPTYWDLPEDWPQRFGRAEPVHGEDVARLHALAHKRMLDGVDHLNAGVSLARTALYRAVAGYDEGYVGWGAEDDDLIKRLRSLGAQLVMTDSYYLHQWHPRYEGHAAEGLQAQIERNRRRLYTTHSVVRNPDGWGRV